MADTRKVLVTGATGNIGRHVVSGLMANGTTVRAMSRSATTAGLPHGVEVVPGDFTDLNSLHRALAGVDAVFLLWPFLASEGASAVAAAIASHAQRVAYVSALHVRDDRSPAENGVWGEVEAAIRRTAIDWTFLRVSGLATNTLGWAAAVRAGQPVPVPYPLAARSLIHERDIADVAVQVLTEDVHAQASYRLTGPTAITQAEQIRILADVAGRPSRVEEITADEARAGMLAWSDAEFADTALAYWASLVAAPEPVTDTVAEITGRPARTFEQWAHDHRDDFRPPSNPTGR